MTNTKKCEKKMTDKTFDTKHPFGDDYISAHLSKVEQDDEVMNKIIPWFSKPKNILYFCGNVGTGKTYLSAAWYNELHDQKKNVRVFKEYYLFAHLREIISKGWDWNIELNRLCEVPYFILDDMGSSQITDWQKEVLFSFLDNRYSSSYPTMITSNLIYEDIKSNFPERFVSRIYAAKNTIIELTGEDRRMRTDFK